MADISTELQAIQEAVYGEEVRGAIVDALEAMNESAEAAEGWATGGSGGTSSATNNAKYYAEQAAQSATSLTIDPTLTQSGQAADAAATGARIGTISATSRNLWREGDVDISGEGGTTKVVLTESLAAGTYTMTCSTQTTYTGTNILVTFFDSETSTGSTHVLANVYFSSNERQSKPVTLTAAALMVRFAAGNSASGSSGYTGKYTGIQIESGETATPYISGFSALDTMARDGLILATGNTTDRKKDIEAALNTFGKCKLGDGDFYVSGVVMPDNTELVGSGSRSRLIMLGDSTVTGICLKVYSECRVSNLSIVGSTEELTLTSTEGGRTGIGYYGSGQGSTIHSAIIDSCWITGFDRSGIRLYNTGYITRGCAISNCHVWNCWCGLDIQHFSEYHKISNSTFLMNWYGAIDNGGNNLISNCGFDRNMVGFLLTNESGIHTNNSHGSISNCTFNHSGANNDGVAIQIAGGSGNDIIQNGMIFTGCQAWYGAINLSAVFGVEFAHCNFGDNTPITITGGNSIFFNNCLFRTVNDSPISVTAASDRIIKFIKCYTRSGGAVVGGSYAE